MEAETLALREGLEEAVVVQYKIAEMLRIPRLKIKMEVFIDNDDLQQAIYSTKQILKGRLLIDLGIIKDMVECREVDSVRWISKDYLTALRKLELRRRISSTR